MKISWLFSFFKYFFLSILNFVFKILFFWFKKYFSKYFVNTFSDITSSIITILNTFHKAFCISILNTFSKEFSLSLLRGDGLSSDRLHVGCFVGRHLMIWLFNIQQKYTYNYFQLERTFETNIPLISKLIFFLARHLKFNH